MCVGGGGGGGGGQRILLLRFFFHSLVINFHVQVRVNDHKDNFNKSKIRFVYQVEYNLPPKENLSIKYLSCLFVCFFVFFL